MCFVHFRKKPYLIMFSATQMVLKSRGDYRYSLLTPPDVRTQVWNALQRATMQHSLKELGETNHLSTFRSAVHAS
jgi:hypothetical protein